MSAQEGKPVSREVLCLHEFKFRAELLSHTLFKAVKSEPVQQDLQPNTAATQRPRIRSKRPSPWSQSWKLSRQGAEALGNISSHALHCSEEDETKCLFTPSLCTLLWEGELLVGMELPGELLVVHWCLRGHRERNCCKGRLQRDISGISRFRQLQKNNQREKTLK